MSTGSKDTGPQTVAGSGRPSSVPDHEFEELEDDSRVPPRPEEEVANAARADAGTGTADVPARGTPDPAAAGTHDAETTEQPV